MRQPMNNVIERPNYEKLLAGKKVSIVNCENALAEGLCAVFSAQGAKVSLYEDGKVPAETDVLVCGTGKLPAGSIEDLGSEALGKALSESLTAVTEAVGTVVPYMKEKKSGTIVSIIPEYAKFSMPGVACLSAVAGAIKSFTAAVAMDYCKFNVRANCVECNLVKSDEPEKAIDYQPIKREITVEDVVNAALFMASPMSSFISGETVTVNGGRFCIGHNQAWQNWLKVI